MLLTLIAAFTLQAEQPVITFESPCISTPALMLELSKQAGEPLYVIGEPAKYDQAVRFDHVPLSSVMSRLAEAHAAEWVKRGEGFQLQRSSPAMNAERIRLHNALVKSIAKRQKEIGEELQKFKKLDQATTDLIASKIRDLKVSADGTPDMTDPFFQDMNKFNASKRAALQMCLAFSPEDLASMDPGSHIVFAINPTSAERNLPDAAAYAVGDLVDAEANMIVLAKAFMEKLSPEAQIPLPSKPARVLLRLSRDADFSNFAVTLTMLTDKGSAMDSANESIDEGDDGDNVTIPLVNTKATAEEKMFAAALGGTVHSDDVSVSSTPPTPNQKEKLFHIDQYHPASLAAGPLLLREASHERANLLVVLNDALVVDLHLAIAQVEKSVKGFRLESSKGSAGWIESYPRDHDMADRVELDKKRFGNFLRAGLSNGSVPLEAQLQLVAECSEGSLISNSLSSAYRQALLVDGEDCFVRPSYLGLVFYGSLSDLQRSQASNKLSFQGLSDEQKNVLSRLVFGEESNLVSDAAISNEMIGEEGSAQAEGAGRYGLSNLPEEMLPNGISYTGSLHIESSFSDALYFLVRTPQGDQAGCVDGGSLAYFAADKNVTFLSLQPAKQGILVLRFQLGSSLGIISSFHANTANGEKVTRIDQLPKSFQDTIMASVEQMKKMQEEGGGVMGGGDDGGPTPPR